MIPTPLQTVRALAKGFLPRVIQPRGWVLALLALLPALTALTITSIIRMQGMGDGVHASKVAMQVLHQVMVPLMLPIMALVAAPAGIREDLEQRTLPLFLVRPAPVWSMPIGKGVIWFGWGSVWLAAAAVGLGVLAGDFTEVPRQALALVFAYWAELAFMTLLGLVFKRGTLWGALYLFIWEGMVRILPGNMQRLTFVHYIESITGTRGGDLSAREILAQTQISSPAWAAVLALLAMGLLFWGLSGWKLQRTPIGLAGAEQEG